MIMKLIICLLVAAPIQFVFAFAKKPVVIEAPQAPSQAPGSSLQPKPEAKLESLLALVTGSECSKYNWKGRGVAPKGYMEGMTLTYAKAVCNPERSDVVFVSQANTGKSGDVFYQYGFKPNAGREALRTTWTLLYGLGMRESSGQYCCGRDASMSFTKGETAEAGLFQTSYNIISFHAENRKLYSQYKAMKEGCYTEYFKQGVQPSYCEKNSKIWGSGEGTNYQKIAKSCPAFSAESAAVTIRFSGGAKGHYGPLRQKSAEYNKSCESLLLKVEKMIESNPELCKQL